MDFLHLISTQDVKSLPPRGPNHASVEGRPTAFLSANGRVLSMGSLCRLDDEKFLYTLGAGDRSTAGILSHLEKFHFSENLEISDASSEWTTYDIFVSELM